MEWIRELWRRAKYLFRRQEFEADLEDELQFHLEMKQAEHEERGVTPECARTAALRRLGNQTLLKEDSRRMWIWGWLEAAAQDTRHTFRLLAKSPGFTLTAVLSLALGIGANTIVFGALHALVLRELPIADPSRVVSVNTAKGPTQSMPNYRDFRDRNSTFESMFAYRMAGMSLEIGDQGAERVWGFLATGNYFQSLGVEPALGRFFTPDDDRQRNASPFAVLSYACWQNRFAGSSDIVGRQIRINGVKYTILGVAPRGFHGTEVIFWPDLWLSMAMQPQIEGWDWQDLRQTWNALVAGRLKPGVTPAQAEANLNAIAGELARAYTTDEGLHLKLSPPGLVGATLREPVQAFGSGVMLLAGLVLLAACANLASLLAARTADRSRELALRVSIGAGRGRIARQLLTESLCISLLGGAAGLALAALLLQVLSRWHAPLDIPIQLDVSADWRVFGFACAAALFTGLLFGIASARRAWRADPAADLKAQSGSGSGRRWSTRDLLLPIQIALCCLLLTASLVAVHGLARSLSTRLGFEPDGVTVVAYYLAAAATARPKATNSSSAPLKRLPACPASSRWPTPAPCR